MLTGCNDGPEGPQGPQGEQGIQGPPGESGIQEERIFELGETFTYISQGLRLFSLRVIEDANAPNGFVLYATNHNMPGYGLNSFVLMRFYQQPLGSETGRTFFTRDFDTADATIITLETTRRINLPLPSWVGSSLWFGWPTAVTTASMIPYAIFRIR